MKLGYITNGLAHHALDDALSLLADLGYEGVGLTLDVNHLNPFTASPQEVAHVASRLQKLNLSVTIETGARFLLDPARKHEPTFITPGETARQKRLAFYDMACHIAADLGAACVSVWAGTDHAKAPEAATWLRDGLKAAADQAAACNVRLAFEPEPGMLVETVADGMALLGELNHPALGLTVDVGHCVVLGEAVGASLQLAGDKLINVHLDDSVAGVHEHLAFGDGELNLAETFSALKAMGYTGPANVELSRHAHMAPVAAKTALDVLRKSIQ